MSFDNRIWKRMLRRRDPGDLTRAESKAVNDVFSDIPLNLPPVQKTVETTPEPIEPTPIKPLAAEEEQNLLAAFDQLVEQGKRKKVKKTKKAQENKTDVTVEEFQFQSQSPHFKEFAQFVPEGFLNYCERARTDFVRAYFAHADKGEKWKRTPEYDDARRKYRGALKEVTTSLRLANQDEKVSLFWEAEGKMLTESWRDHTRFEHHPAPVREVLEDSPLAYLEDIDPSIALEFTAARDVYFNAYFARAQKGVLPPHYEEHKKWYDTASAAVAHEIRMARMDTKEPNDAWKELVIDRLLTDEINRLTTLSAEGKSTQAKKTRERSKKVPWLRRTFLGFLGVATLQSADVGNDAPPQYGFEPMDDERVAPAPDVEKIKVSIPPVEASARGIHQMLKLMLEHVRAQEPEAYRVLVHPGEQPIDAARRISKETSMWIPDADLSLIVQKNRTDRIEFRDGDLVLVRATGGDIVEYVLTHGGIAVPHEWNTKEYSHYDS